MAEAVAGGCRKAKACEALGISAKTLDNWKNQTELVDGRTTRKYQPEHKLTEEERAEVLALVNSPEFRDLSPCQIVPILADQGRYLASESTLYRILRQERMLTHRQSSRPPKHQRPQPQTATGPKQVWTWDITYLPCQVRGMFFYLYLIVDIFSRKIVGWEVHEAESAEYASPLIAKAHGAEQVGAQPLVLHADNGGPMKGATMLATLQRLGVVPSFSRPMVSDDNPYSEALHRTLKYRPEYPWDRFEDLEHARRWTADFVGWYNTKHRHSALKFVTPEQRHQGRDLAILAERDRL